jgi:hypothetical protein
VGIPAEEILNLLKRKAVESHEILTKEYPLGYILLGVSEGRIIYLPEVDNGNHFSADWPHCTLTIIQPGPIAEIKLIGLGWIDNLRNTGARNDYLETFPFTEGKPWKASIQPFETGRAKRETVYFEVLDQAKKIFIIGFK